MTACSWRPVGGPELPTGRDRRTISVTFQVLMHQASHLREMAPAIGPYCGIDWHPPELGSGYMSAQLSLEVLETGID